MKVTFKVGDIVRVLDGSECEDYIGELVQYMNQYVNTIQIVSYSDEKSNHVELENSCCIFDARYLKLVKTIPGVKRVIVNDPATIIIWDDETKTVVKCGDNDIFDAEKGIAMAIVKRLMFDNKSTQMNKWFKEQIPDEEIPDFYDIVSSANKF
jgi:hypothetical protein